MLSDDVGEDFEDSFVEIDWIFYCVCELMENLVFDVEEYIEVVSEVGDCL